MHTTASPCCYSTAQIASMQLLLAQFVVFARAARQWGADSFTDQEKITEKHPIEVPTILVLDVTSQCSSGLHAFNSIAARAVSCAL